MHPIFQEIKHLDRSRRALRSFGCVVGSACIVVGAALGWWQLSLWMGIVPSSVGVVLILLGLAIPQFLRQVHYVWMAAAIVMGYIMTRVLLTVVFYLLLTPLGLLMRLFGSDPMRRKIDRTASTYWIARKDPTASKERLEKYY